MIEFDFKKYHVRAMNAGSELEKAKINKELKDMYERLSEEDKAIFNEQLQTFLISEMAKINSVYDGIKKEAE